MLAAMKELREWQRRSPTDFAQTFEKLLLKADKSEEERRLVDSLDLDRRKVTGFFYTIQTLCEGNVIDEHFAHRTFGGGTYRFLKDVLVPMENAKTDAMLKKQDMSAADKLATDKRQADVIAFYARVFQ